MCPISHTERPRAALPRVLLGQGLASLTSFVTLLALGRFGGESQLGLFALGWTSIFLALSLTDTLVATPYTYYRARDAGGDATTRAAIDLSMAASWGVLTLAVAFVLGLSVVRTLDLWGLSSMWPALPLALAATVLREFRRRHLLAVGNTSALLRMDAFGAVLQLSGIAALVVTGRLAAFGALLVVAVTATLVLLPLASAGRLRRLRAAAGQTRAVMRRFVDYGHWLLLGGLCHVASVQAYPWLAFAAGGTRQAGLFAAAAAVLNLLSPLLTGLTNHFRPVLMAAQLRLPSNAFTAKVMRTLPLFVAPALLLLLTVALAGEWLVTQLYGARFADAAPALPWLGVGLLAVAFGAPLQLGLLALGAPSSNLAYHGSSVLVLSLAALALGTLPLQPLAQAYAAANVLATAVLAAWFLRRGASE